MEARHRWAVLLLVALVGLAAAAPAHAGLSPYKGRAWFKATVEGTYTAHGTETNDDCYRYVSEDQTEPLTVTTNVDEKLQFKSVRSVKVEADRYLTGDIGAGSLNRRTPVAVTTTRTLTATAKCYPQSPDPVCGTKSLHFGMSLISRDSPLRLAYNFNDGSVIFPDDPFDFACRVPAVPWWGKADSGGARLPGKKLFKKGQRRIKIKGHSEKSYGKATEAHGQYALDYTVTLVRTHR
jgi:hypothetical protein